MVKEFIVELRLFENVTVGLWAKRTRERTRRRLAVSEVAGI
jgi:hypothetical protein